MAEISINSRSLRLTLKTTLISTGAIFRTVTVKRLLKPSNILMETSCYNSSIIKRNLIMY